MVDNHVRWAFVNAPEPYGSERFALVTSSKASEAVMGRVEKGKQNNFSIEKLSAHWKTWDAFCTDLAAFPLD
jgi:hypothetical protein